MGKKFSLLTVIMLICIMACSCAAPSEQTLPDSAYTETAPAGVQTENRDAFDIALDINNGIFDLAPCLPGFTPTTECNTFRYQLEDIHLSLRVYDKTTPVEDIYPGDTDSYEKRAENGTDYYIRTRTDSWDGIEDETGKAENGETTTTEILFYIDEYVVVLTGSANDRNTSDVTLQLATDLLSKTPNDSLEQLGSGLFAKLWNGTMECIISFIPKDDADYHYWLNAQGTVIEEEDNIRYLASIRERSPDDPNESTVICDTDEGVLRISCGVPYSERNNVPAEELDFINLSLARKVAERLGVVITSISE